MKKKALAAIFFAAAMCMPIAACGKEDKAPDLTPDTDFGALISEQVTKAQWDAAFSNEAFAGVTVKYTMRSSSWSTNLLIDFGYQKTNEGYDICFLVTDTDEAMDHDFVAHIAGTQATEYYGGDGAYTYAPGVIEGDSHAAVLNREWMYTFRAYVAYDLVGQFGKFDYDETLHAYTYAGDTLEVKYTPGEAMGSSYTISEATVKFSGGKLAYAKIKMPGDDEMEEEFFYYDYGKTKVVIPTDAQPDLTESTDFDSLVSEKVTAAQWDAAFTDEAFAGCSMDFGAESVVRHVDFGYQTNAEAYDIYKCIITYEESDTLAVRQLDSIGSDVVTTYLSFGSAAACPPGCTVDTWYTVTTPMSATDDEYMDHTSTFRNSLSYDFAGQFDKFTYDETLHAYTYAGDTIVLKYCPWESGFISTYKVSKATLKFAGGKLAYAKVTISNGAEEVYKYYDYGKTKVVIPTDAQPMPKE